MGVLGSVQFFIYWGLSLAALGMQVFALADAGRHRADAFPASGNQTKQLWLIILGIAVAVGVVSLPNFLGPINILNLAAIVAAGVYLAKVRPAVRAITGGGSAGGYSGSW